MLSGLNWVWTTDYFLGVQTYKYFPLEISVGSQSSCHSGKFTLELLAQINVPHESETSELFSNK